MWSRIKTKVAAARAAVVDRYRTAKEAVTTTMRTLSTLMPLRRMVLVAFGVGLVVTVLGFFAPAGIAAVLAGVGGVVTAAVAQVGSWFRRSLRGFSTSYRLDCGGLRLGTWQVDHSPAGRSLRGSESARADFTIDYRHSTTQLSWRAYMLVLIVFTLCILLVLRY